MKDSQPASAEALKVRKAWTLYDWANSVYSLVITTAIFPIFYNAITEDEVTFFGAQYSNTQLYAYVLAASFVVVITLNPLLSGLADYAGKKKFFMKVFCYTGAAACTTMYFFNPDYLEWSLASLFFANIGFWGSLGFYNAYLPEIAPPEEHDRLGARGYIMGYIGSLILLIASLVMIKGFDISPRWSFVLVGIWWVVWAQPAFRKLPVNPFRHQATGNLWSKGFEELRGVARDLADNQGLKRYLLSFFIISMALQTIMLMATSFGIKEVGLQDAELIVAIIAVQLLAIPGALTVAWLSGKIGNIKALMACTVVWAAVCVYAYAGVNSTNGFFVAAGVIGFMMGGTQSLNRSTYSKMLPETEDHASYFSFYEVLEKGGLIIGMFSWGYIEGITGSMRASVLTLILYFAAALLVMVTIPKGAVRKG